MSEPNPYQASEAVYENLPPEPDAKSFGGWLILPLLGLAFSLVRESFSLLTNYLPMFSNGTWAKLTTPGSVAYHPLWAPMFSFEIVGALGIVALSLTTLAHFINKSKTTPKLMIGFLLFNLALTTGDAIFTSFIPYFDTHHSTVAGPNLARAIFSVLIWAPYFLKSERVRTTFVRNWPRKPVSPA